MNSITLNKKVITAKAVTIIIAIAAAVILPQIFHLIGGGPVGASLLPMHIPVLFAGFLGGPVVGIIAGVLSPLVSFGISGMPTAAMLPFMMLELGAYGVAAGVMSKTKLNSFVQLIIVQLAGRAVRGLAIIFSIYVLGNQTLTLASIGVFIVTGIWGILLQWAVIPLAINHMDSVKKLYK